MSMSKKVTSQQTEKLMQAKDKERQRWVKAMTTKFALSPEPVSIGPCRTSEWSLQAEMMALAETAASASFVNLPVLELTARKALALAYALYKKETDKDYHLKPIKIEDYLHSAKNLCTQLKNTRVSLKDLEVGDVGRNVGGGDESSSEDDEVVGNSVDDDEDIVDLGFGAMVESRGKDVGGGDGARVEGGGKDVGGGDGARIEGSGKDVGVGDGARVEGCGKDVGGGDGARIESGGKDVGGGEGACVEVSDDDDEVDFVGVNFGSSGARVEGGGRDVGGGAGARVEGGGKDVGVGEGSSVEVVEEDESDGAEFDGGFVVARILAGDGKGASARVEDGKVKKKPHAKNPMRKCHFCKFSGHNIKRHIQKHHANKVTGEGDVEKAIFIEVQKERRGRNQRSVVAHKHEHLYQCGIKGCGKLVTRMTQHLKRKHKLVNPKALKEALDKFVKQSGTKLRRPTKTTSKSSKSTKTATATKTAPASKRPLAMASLPSLTSTKRKASATPSLAGPEKKRQRRSEDSDSSFSEMSSESEDTWQPSDSFSQVSNRFAENHLLDVQADLDDVNGDFAEEDEVEENEMEPVEVKKWADVYSNIHLYDTARHHFLCSFYTYLQHVEGGDQPPQQCLIIVRHVHKILEDIEPRGKGLKALVQNHSLDIWEKFAKPRLVQKINKGDTLKVYLRSLELFASFIQKGLFYDRGLLTDDYFYGICSLITRLPNYRKTIHRRTAVHHTTK